MIDPGALLLPGPAQPAGQGQSILEEVGTRAPFHLGIAGIGVVVEAVLIVLGCISTKSSTPISNGVVDLGFLVEVVQPQHVVDALGGADPLQLVGLLVVGDVPGRGEHVDGGAVDVDAVPPGQGAVVGQILQGDVAQRGQLAPVIVGNRA